jgi:hypothetical protein
MRPRGKSTSIGSEPLQYMVIILFTKNHARLIM